MKPQIIQHMGYPAETHHVTTEDGYILEIHRIPNHQQKTNRYHQLPIFITHGFLSSSSSFVMNLNQSLGKHIFHIITCINNL